MVEESIDYPRVGGVESRCIEIQPKRNSLAQIFTCYSDP